MAVNGMTVIYYAARPLNTPRIVMMAAVSTAMLTAVVTMGTAFSLTALSFAAWLVLIVLTLLVVPVQMSLEKLFDLCSAALEARHSRISRRRSQRNGE